MKTTLAILGIVAAFAMITATIGSAYATDPCCGTQTNNQAQSQSGSSSQSNNIGGGTLSSTHTFFTSQKNIGGVSQSASQIAANVQNSVCAGNLNC